MTALLFEMNKENMTEKQKEKDLIDKISEFLLINIKTLPIPFASVVKMKLKFEIRFLMGMLVGLFALF